MLVARWMGSAAYGVMGILSAVNSTVLNFVDLRLNDVMAKLYFGKEPPEGTSTESFRASLIQSSLVCYGILSLAFLVIGFAVTYAFSRFFTATEIRLQWALASALGTSITYFVNPIGYMLRLAGRFYLLGWQVMAGGLISSGIMVSCVFLSKDLDGYYAGYLCSNLVGAGIAIAVSLTVWIRIDGLPVLSRLDLSALRWIKEHSGLLFWGNLMGYTKLGHRAADVLLVGLFCDDRLTGLYKLARTLTDRLYILFDALNQVYFPSLLGALAKGQTEAFRRQARRLLLGAAGLTLAFLAGELLLLPFFSEAVLKGKFQGVEPAIMVLTLPFFLQTGLYIWTWPLVLQHNLADRFTLYSGIALLIQYAFSISVFKSSQSLWAFTGGYLAFYVMLYLLVGAFLLRKFPEYLPFRRSAERVPV